MKATREAFGKHLPIMGEKYDNILALDADLGKATKIASFGETHPKRIKSRHICGTWSRQYQNPLYKQKMVPILSF